MTPIAILAAKRTPIGAFQGALASVPAPMLGAVAVRAVVPDDVAKGVSDVFMGHVLQAGVGQAPARQAALRAGLSEAVRCVTVHKVCGSGLQAVIDASRALHAGDGAFAIAGGMENMSLAPYLLPKARQGYRLGNHQVIDSMIHDGLWDPYDDLHMGACAEECARKYSFGREEQDAYAIESFRRANAAQQSGAVADEIVKVDVPDGRAGVQCVTQDEGPAKVKYEKIPTLKPAFAKDGTITAANASTLNDGAAALLLSTEANASAAGIRAIARIVAFGAHAQAPKWFTTAPVKAAQHALRRAGWTPDQVGVWEVNEAFAVVALAFMREMQVPHDRLNVRGGAIALGHPIGASGARILVTLVSIMRERSLRRGVAAICIGGGEALAACVELV